MKEFDEAVRKSLFSYVPRWIHPNHLSILRFVLLAPLLLVRSDPTAAVVVVLFSSLCDLLDGPLARVRGLKSEAGAMLDAVSDKIFILGALFFVCPERVPENIRWAVLVIDVLLIAVRPVKSRYGITVSANAFGACKLWTQTIGLCLVLLDDRYLYALVLPVFLTAIFLAICDLAMHINDIAKKLR